MKTNEYKRKSFDKREARGTSKTPKQKAEGLEAYQKRVGQGKFRAKKK